MPGDPVAAKVDAEFIRINSVEEARRYAWRSILQRRGQSRFRRELLSAYEGACCITDTDAEPALEAAHIRPYDGIKTNTVTNGLLLRADVHTLFDCRLVTVSANDFRVRVAPALRSTAYGSMDRMPMRRPVKAATPNQMALAEHNAACGLAAW